VTTPDPDRRPPEDVEDLDPGLARARTALAWRRTAISYAALGAALLKASPAVGALVLAGSALIWAAGRLASRRRLLLVTVAVTSVAIGALVLALLARSALPLR
jgi:uncharacterized membrane protein YidH (DUF202 family)